jgi:hypothetical protein
MIEGPYDLNGKARSYKNIQLTEKCRVNWLAKKSFKSFSFEKNTNTEL